MKKKKSIKLNIVFAPRRELFPDGFFETWLAEEPLRRFSIRYPALTPKQKKSWNGNSYRANPELVDVLAYDFIGNPDAETDILFRKTCGCCRFLWNKMKSDRDDAYKKDKTVLKTRPAEYKKDPKFLWLNEVDSLALCNVQLNLERAYRDFLSGDKGKPDFKKKGVSRESFTTNLSNRDKPNLRLEGNLLYLPKVKKPIPLKLHRPVKLGGMLKRCTVSLDPTGKWHFALTFEYPAEETPVKEPVLRFLEDGDIDALKHIGLDMSLPHLYIDSNGEKPRYSLKDSVVSFEKHYRKLEDRIVKEQRKLSRMQEGSSNYEKQQVRIAKLHAKAKHQRADFLHQMSIRLVREYDVISIEDIDLAAMKKALRFGKSVSDNGWGMFVTMLQYKAERCGALVVKVDRWFPSSKTCSKCGHVHKDLKLSDRVYYCPECGNMMDRDRQAGINLDREGLRILLDTYEKNDIR